MASRVSHTTSACHFFREDLLRRASRSNAVKRESWRYSYSALSAVGGCVGSVPIKTVCLSVFAPFRYTAFNTSKKGVAPQEQETGAPAGALTAVSIHSFRCAHGLLSQPSCGRL